MAIKHKVIRFDCNQCDYQGTDEDKLGIHKKKAHEAKVHACDKCHSISSILGEMNEYVDTMHKVIGYDCDKIQLCLTHSFNLFVVLFTCQSTEHRLLRLEKMVFGGENVGFKR